MKNILIMNCYLEFFEFFGWAGSVNVTFILCDAYIFGPKSLYCWLEGFADS